MPDILSKDEIDKLLTHPRHVLVVHAASAPRMALVKCLTDAGNLVVHEVETGPDALDLLQKNAYHLLIVDWDLPELNGEKLIGGEIRNRSKLAALPVLAITAHAVKSHVVEVFRAGVDDLLLAPYEAGIMLKKAQALLKGRPAGDLTQRAPNALSETPSQREIDQMQTKWRDPSRRVVTYDFKHPQRISKDQQRTLENLHSNLSRMMAASFSSLQRAVVDVDIAFVDQTTYAEFIMSLSNPSCSYTFTIEPLGGPGIIDFALPVAYSFIDRQFGGKGVKLLQEARLLTAIERTVMGKVVTRTLANLEATWEALLKIRVSDAELETNPEFMQVAAPSDTVVLIAFEVNTAHASGLVNVCYPYFTLEPVMAYLNVSTWASRERGRRESGRDERLEQLEHVTLPVAAQLARAEVALQDLVGVQVGDVLTLDSRIDDPAVVFVGGRPKFLARPTRQGERMAVQLTQRIVKEHMPRYMNSVQKTDTYIL